MNKEINDIEYNPHVGALLDPNGTFTQYGITLLDHFAGLALNAFIIAHKGTYAEIYDESYSIADKMLKARKEVYGE